MVCYGKGTRASAARLLWALCNHLGIALLPADLTQQRASAQSANLMDSAGTGLCLKFCCMVHTTFRCFVQSLDRAPGFNALLFYDFRNVVTGSAITAQAAAAAVTYTRRWPRSVSDGDVACCYPGMAHFCAEVHGV